MFSAGLRVLLMMYKSLENKDNFELTGVSDEVREILEATGFDQFLLKQEPGAIPYVHRAADPPVCVCSGWMVSETLAT